MVIALIHVLLQVSAWRLKTMCPTNRLIKPVNDKLLLWFTANPRAMNWRASHKGARWIRSVGA